MRHYFFLVALLIAACGSSHAQQQDEQHEPASIMLGGRETEAESDELANLDRPDSRRLFSLWSSVLFVLHPCPPFGPEHEKCMKSRSSTSHSSGGSSSSSSSGSSGGSGSSSYDDKWTDGGKWSDDCDDKVTSHAEDNKSGGKSGASTGGASKVTMWMLIVAAVASMFAIGAVVMGQRKVQKEPHPLSGSVSRRMGLFSSFADSALCATADRPARVVEMTASGEDYQMA